MAKKKSENAVKESETGVEILHLKNLDGDTCPRDLVGLFWAQGFHPQSVEIRLPIPEDLRLTEAYVDLPNEEAWDAADWAYGYVWRGNRLDAELVDTH